MSNLYFCISSYRATESVRPQWGHEYLATTSRNVNGPASLPVSQPPLTVLRHPLDVGMRGLRDVLKRHLPPLSGSGRAGFQLLFPPLPPLLGQGVQLGSDLGVAGEIGGLVCFGGDLLESQPAALVDRGGAFLVLAEPAEHALLELGVQPLADLGVLFQIGRLVGLGRDVHERRLPALVGRFEPGLPLARPRGAVFGAALLQLPPAPRVPGPRQRLVRPRRDVFDRRAPHLGRVVRAARQPLGVLPRFLGVGGVDGLLVFEDAVGVVKGFRAAEAILQRRLVDLLGVLLPQAVQFGRAVKGRLFLPGGRGLPGRPAGRRVVRAGGRVRRARARPPEFFGVVPFGVQQLLLPPGDLLPQPLALRLPLRVLVQARHLPGPLSLLLKLQLAVNLRLRKPGVQQLRLPEGDLVGQGAQPPLRQLALLAHPRPGRFGGDVVQRRPAPPVAGRGRLANLLFLGVARRRLRVRDLRHLLGCYGRAPFGGAELPPLRSPQQGRPARTQRPRSRTEEDQPPPGTTAKTLCRGKWKGAFRKVDRRKNRSRRARPFAEKRGRGRGRIVLPNDDSDRLGRAQPGISASAAVRADLLRQGARVPPELPGQKEAETPLLAQAGTRQAARTRSSVRRHEQQSFPACSASRRARCSRVHGGAAAFDTTAEAGAGARSAGFAPRVKRPVRRQRLPQGGSVETWLLRERWSLVFCILPGSPCIKCRAPSNDSGPVEPRLRENEKPAASQRGLASKQTGNAGCNRSR
ncbi:MAG: hypothetical protein BJ554DRAFT_6570 [Olpidium bornovanus]|uniref:Uncharacterized protein n=1 Tax=Olpidium bornovanus TaxID=278681 RepID=A0A8H7ZXH8_9FUNG|nr:MAG: hypothetical protein BJ554DRAFT_6570 [Olpidium bornovanus]